MKKKEENLVTVKNLNQLFLTKVTLLPRRHLTMPGDTFGCHSSGWSWGAPGVW